MRTTTAALGSDMQKAKMPVSPLLPDRQPQCGLADDAHTLGRHVHKEIEMAYVLSGQAEIKVEGRVFTLSAGELLCIRGSVPHEYLQATQKASVLKIMFVREWLLPAFFASEQKEACQKLYSQIFKARPSDALRELMLSTLHCPLPGFKEYFCYGKLVELTACLLAMPESIEETLPSTKENQRYMQTAIDFMQSNCHNRLTLKMLSDHLGLTESYCSKYIKKNAGISFVEYLNAMRINDAQQLLSCTDCNIAEIVRKTGFLSVQTFNRVFKQQTGKSPSEYRKYMKRRPCK